MVVVGLDDCVHGSAVSVRLALTLDETPDAWGDPCVQITPTVDVLNSQGALTLVIAEFSDCPALSWSDDVSHVAHPIGYYAVSQPTACALVRLCQKRPPPAPPHMGGDKRNKRGAGPLWGCLVSIFHGGGKDYFSLSSLFRIPCAIFLSLSSGMWAK